MSTTPRNLANQAGRLATQTTQAKVFWTGRSQAVRIPAEFRLDCEHVEVTKTKDGGLLLKPAEGWPKDFLKKISGGGAGLRRPPQGKLTRRIPL